MHARFFVLVFSLAAFAPSSRADDPKPAEPLAAFDRFVGGAWVSEGDFKVRVVYEWGLNKKLLKLKSYLVGEEGPRLVYESVVYWHPEKKHIAFQSVSGQGGLFDGVMTVDGKTYRSEFTSYTNGTSSQFKQSIEFLDDDNVLWTVQGKRDGEWVTLNQTKEHRERTPEASDSANAVPIVLLPVPPGAMIAVTSPLSSQWPSSHCRVGSERGSGQR